MVKVKEKQIKKATDRVLIQGLVTVWQGEGKDKKVIFKKAENHWVDGGLKGLLSWLVGSYLSYRSTLSAGQNPIGFKYWCYDFRMYLGSNTATATTHGMTVLVSPIGTAPGTAPNSVSGASRGNPATGQWNTSYLAVWNAGTISGTVGEMAVYLRPFTNISAGWSLSPTADWAYAMVSRLSVADGDFGAFSIDTTKSLTVQWEIKVTFA